MIEILMIMMKTSLNSPPPPLNAGSLVSRLCACMFVCAWVLHVAHSMPEAVAQFPDLQCPI